MQRSSRQQSSFILGIVFLAAPFIAATIRAVGSGSDFRMFWMAIASLLGTLGVMAFATRRSFTSLAPLSLSVFVVATLLAGTVARFLGARALFGVWAIAVVFGLCDAAGCAFNRLSRPSPAG